MTIVCHTRKFIFLKTRKTAGSSIEIWLAPHLDPDVDFIRLGDDSEKQHPDLWKRFNGLSSRIRLAAKRVGTLSPIFRPHMPAADVRRFVGDRRWRDYRKITIVRNPWDRMISAWRWRFISSVRSSIISLAFSWALRMAVIRAPCSDAVDSSSAL